MRKIILAGSLLALAAPATLNAQSSSTFPAEMDAEIADSLPHPFEIEEAGDRLGDAVGAILDMPIGGVVRAIDPHADVRRDDSIADVAGRDDPYFERTGCAATCAGSASAWPTSYARWRWSRRCCAARWPTWSATWTALSGKVMRATGTIDCQFPDHNCGRGRARRY